MAPTMTIEQKKRQCKRMGKVYDTKTKRCRESRRESSGPTLAEKKVACERAGRKWNPDTKRCNTVASRRSVFAGHGKTTAGGLTRSDLFKDKYGRIRSRKASSVAKRRWAQMDPMTKAIFKAHQYR